MDIQSFRGLKTDDYKDLVRRLWQRARVGRWRQASEVASDCTTCGAAMAPLFIKHSCDL